MVHEFSVLRPLGYLYIYSPLIYRTAHFTVSVCQQIYSFFDSNNFGLEYNAVSVNFESVSDAQAWAKEPCTRSIFHNWYVRLYRKKMGNYGVWCRCQVCGCQVVWSSALVVCNHWFWPRLVYAPHALESQNVQRTDCAIVRVSWVSGCTWLLVDPCPSW